MDNQKQKSAPLDIIGDEIGKVKIINVLGKDKNNRYVYLCQCLLCKKYFNVNRSTLISKEIYSCGCNKEKKAKTDIIGNEYKCLKVVDYADKIDNKAHNGSTQNRYLFKCICKKGKEFILEKNKLKKGKFSFDCFNDCDECIKNIESRNEICKVEFLGNNQIKLHTSDGVRYTRYYGEDPRSIIGQPVGELIPNDIIGAKMSNNGGVDFMYSCNCSCGNTCIRSKSELKIETRQHCDDHNKFDICSIDVSGRIINGIKIEGLISKYNKEYIYRGRCVNCEALYRVKREDILNSTVDHCKCIEANLRKVIRFYSKEN